ncbi:MAG: hypothetical protein L0312_21340 [Acidobacteria bacterium]|nr:hypothetical protein [Acidobacteriota bacterium]
MGEFLETADVRRMAEEGLPAHYRLTNVTFTYGTDTRQLEIHIEYQSSLDEALEGTNEDIEAHQRWAFPLLERIRAHWPPGAVGVVFSQRSAE